MFLGNDTPQSSAQVYGPVCVVKMLFTFFPQKDIHSGSEGCGHAEEFPSLGAE
jgi:hypothetical protein